MRARAPAPPPRRFRARPWAPRAGPAQRWHPRPRAPAARRPAPAAARAPSAGARTPPQAQLAPPRRRRLRAQDQLMLTDRQQAPDLIRNLLRLGVVLHELLHSVDAHDLVDIVERVLPLFERAEHPQVLCLPTYRLDELVDVEELGVDLLRLLRLELLELEHHERPVLAPLLDERHGLLLHLLRLPIELLLVPPEAVPRVLQVQLGAVLRRDLRPRLPGGVPALPALAAARAHGGGRRRGARLEPNPKPKTRSPTLSPKPEAEPEARPEARRSSWNPKPDARA
eukprot:CAMPEP_0118856162 /NCGR_PEP_ID=MMETSP1163-20130328/3737_1 /TAXON_ID=124430 /ORGANISM="Phaeomonas parva, Strain CCMP2877" /LENGTH=282 /DNA_ID=CAMNT_0006789215 /DNA_START=244 /DNA_END=1093 /DNA_ORIENTATION=-